MATEVFTTENIILLDGTEVKLRPLSIAKMRKFSRLWAEHMSEIAEKLTKSEAEDANEVLVGADLTDAQFTTFIQMCALGLESQLKEDKTEKEFLAYLEDVLDEKSIQRILERTGGLKLGGEDPNLNPAAVAGLVGVGTA